MQGLLKDLKKDVIKKIYVFYGPETYLLRYYKRVLMQKLIPEGMEMNLHVFEDSIDFASVVDRVESYPFLHDKRLLVFDHINISKNFTPELHDLLERLPDYCYVLFLETELDKRTKAYKYFDRICALTEFQYQSVPALQKWVCSQVAALNMQITNKAVDLLLSLSGEEMDNIYNELQKIINYCFDRKKIYEEDVLTMAVPTLSNRIFEMINRGLRGEVAKSLRMYREMLLLKESPVKVLILMNRQYMQLLHIKEAKDSGCTANEIAKVLKMNPYILKKEYYDSIDGFNIEFLQKKVKYGCELETKLKSGELSDKLAVELLLLHA